MSVNIDKQAEDTACALMGMVKCRCCKGTGKAVRKDRGWGRRIMADCAFCHGKRWLHPYMNLRGDHMKIRAYGGVTSWQVYYITADQGSDYEVDADLMRQWEEARDSFNEVQEKLKECLTLVKKEKP